MSKKQYGLILPGQLKLKALGTRKLNPLQDSDDELEKSDEEIQPLDWVEQSLKKSAGNTSQQSQQKRLLKEALQEDSSVFQYDEVYDDMKQKQEAAIQKKKNPVDKKPRYIENILKQSARRKIENERRLERKVQKERDAEQGEFADKESFISASYLKKQEELAKAERLEQIELAIEEKYEKAGERNFHNHLFKQLMGETEIKKEPVEIEPEAFQSRKETRPRNIRKRSSSKESSSEEEQKPIKKEPSSSSETSSDEEKPKKKKRKSDKRMKEEENDSKSNVPVVPLTLPKITKEDKWRRVNELSAKQTIGEKFVEAVKRYYERKAARQG